MGLSNEKDGFVAFWAPAYMFFKGRYHWGYRPMLYATIEALGSLPSVTLS